MLKGFRDFVLRGNIIDLAVAVVVGTAFNAVVQSVVRDLLTPLIAAIGGQRDFNNLTFTIHHSVFRYGDVLNSVISFLFVAIAIYYFVMVPMRWVMERRRRGDQDAPPPSDEVVLLTQIRDLLQRAQGSPPGEPRPASPPPRGRNGGSA